MQKGSGCTMPEKDDELDEIFVNKNEPADKKLIVEILKPFVTIDKDGVLEFKDAYEPLNPRKKILIYLVCKKAMFLRGLLKNEQVGPKEIGEGAQISENSAKDISRDKILVKVVKKEKQGYFIPNYALRKVKVILFGENKDGK